MTSTSDYARIKQNADDVYDYFTNSNYHKEYVLSVTDCNKRQHEDIISYFFPDDNEPIKTEFLFNWKEIPGSDDKKLKNFLNQDFSIDWVKTGKIEKINDDRTIRISDDNDNFLSLELDDKKTKVNLIIDGDKIDELIVKPENDKLNIYKTINFFYIARRFNSYTPALPVKKKKNTGRKGGGYLISWNGKLIAIDPGYHFIENIYFNENIRIKDIDCIIITHSHPDHVSDFENMLMLLYEYNDELKKKHKGDNENIKYHYVDVFLNLTASQRFLSILESNEFIKKIKILNPGDKIELNDYNFTLKLIANKHEEFHFTEYTVGLMFYLYKNDEIEFTLGLTSDTGWKEKLDMEYKDANLLIVHLGGIKLREIEVNFEEYKLPELFYENHLGFLGAYNLISGVDSKHIVLSEFGDELLSDEYDIRIQTSEILSELLSKYKSVEKKIIPGDIGLKIYIPESKIKCNDCNKLFNFEDINFTKKPDLDTDDSHYAIIYLCNICNEKLGSVPD